VKARHEFDFYQTPAWMTRALMKRAWVHDVLEPCSGDNAIRDVLWDDRKVDVISNVLDPSRPAELHLDATTEAAWEEFDIDRPRWVVTNPPFNLADQIVPLAVKYVPSVAMLLRLSWLEPTKAREGFLKAYPPNRLIVMPRHDFRGTGQTDSVTSAWFIWEREGDDRGIEIVTKAERDELITKGAA